jgi:hypothetical protein
LTAVARCAGSAAVISLKGAKLETTEASSLDDARAIAGPPESAVAAVLSRDSDWNWTIKP